MSDHQKCYLCPEGADFLEECPPGSGVQRWLCFDCAEKNEERQ